MNSNKLKIVRLERGISISELARRTKLSRITLTKIENNESNPTASTIYVICQVLKRNPTDIFFSDFVNQEIQNGYKYDKGDKRVKH